MNRNRKRLCASLRTGAAACLASLAFAIPAAAADSPIRIATEALVESTVTSDRGEQEVQRVPASKIMPGMTLIFVNTITNSGTDAVEGLVVNNPIPEHMLYLDGTAEGADARVTFSVDGGASFDRPEKLTVPLSDGSHRSATGADYTHIRWQLTRPLPPGGKEMVEFKARVE